MKSNELKGSHDKLPTNLREFEQFTQKLLIFLKEN